MGCCQYFEPSVGGADSFTVEMPRITFGRGSLGEAGERARALGMRRAALFTDPYLAGSAHVANVKESLKDAGVDAAVFPEVLIEPGDEAVMQATKFLDQGNFDGLVSVGGGSVIDTAKAAMIYHRYPAAFTAYFAPPVGEGQPVPGPVLPHLACPTTSGTGSETTGLSVIRIEALNVKYVIASRYLLPDEAIVDPACTDSLPPMVVASSGFDLMSHAIECYTARAYTRWAKVDKPDARPMIQGANPWSDLHAREALRIVGGYLERGVADAKDTEARDRLMWGATLAGMAFGNCGTHLPHAFSYAVSNLVKSWRAKDYPMGEGAFIPHGVAVILNSPSVFRFTAHSAPERHLEAADCLGADIRDAVPDDAGEVVADRIIGLMKTIGIPNGLGGVGLSAEDAGALSETASSQRRAIGNAPRDLDKSDIAEIFARAVRYW
ncbi:MAG TPA: hydroxyacid-oxoacid transhydrogenase [Gammaproteobacteria bacterium]|nr:hydroxyacid-oxoacid transhydrogenase [Gammaproteobacteria bacterium]